MLATARFFGCSARRRREWGRLRGSIILDGHASGVSLEQISRNLGRSFNVEPVMLPCAIGIRGALVRTESGRDLLAQPISVDAPRPSAAQCRQDAPLTPTLAQAAERPRAPASGAGVQGVSTPSRGRPGPTVSAGTKSSAYHIHARRAHRSRPRMRLAGNIPT